MTLTRPPLPHRAGHAASAAHRQIVELFHFASLRKGGGLFIRFRRVAQDNVDGQVLYQGHEHKAGTEEEEQ